MSTRSESLPDPQPLDEPGARLRVALRLAFDDAVADELAGRVRDENDVAALGRVLRSARSRLGLDHALRLLPGRRPAGVAPPLGAASAVRPDDAAALIARVGLGLDVVATADLLETTAEQVAASLFAGRRALDRPIGKACDRYAEAIGEYDDPAADPDDRVALVTHARSCQSCRTAIDRSRQVDAWLQSEMERIAVRLGSMPPVRDRTTWLRPELLLPAGLAVVGVLLVLAGFALVDRLTTPPHTPVPALAATAPDPALSGWLLTSGTSGSVQAENLRTGQTRTLFPVAERGPQWPLLSPDHSKVALVRPVRSSNEPSIRVEVTMLDGAPVGTHDWDAGDHYLWPIGWLDSSSLLAVETPAMAAGESRGAYQARIAADSGLVQVDAATGAIRDLARGDIGYAVAAPDSRSVVVFSTEGPLTRQSTVTLRPLTGAGLGEPLWTYDMGVGRPIWSSSGDALYAAVNVGDPASNGLLVPAEVDDPPPAIVAVARDGTLTTIVEPRELGETAIPVTVTPDGHALIVAAGDSEGEHVRYWRVDLTSGERNALAEGSARDGWPLDPVWSPDGGYLLLPVREPFYLAAGDAATANPAGDSGIALLGYDGSWQRRLVGGWLDTSRAVLAWLPEDRLPDAEPPRIGDAPVITAPEEVRGLLGQLQTSPDSAASPDGRYVILYDGDQNIPVIWDREGNEGRHVSGDSSQLSWLPGGRAVFGVVPFADAANRLVGFAADTRDIIVSVDFQRFDPARLGQDVRSHYERPLVSPDGTTMSFFVVDETRNEIALWLAGWGREPQRVTSWTVPADAIPPRPLAAAWIDDRTLLFARADRWDRGMPRQSTLVRVVVDGDDVEVDDLASIEGRGGDRGVVMEEMAISPDRTQLAYRLRHYRSFAADRERRDIVRVVALSDVTSPIEIASGGTGAGISWAPDGQWLVTSTSGRILVAASDGRTIRDVAEDVPAAAHPVWVGNEVWFSVADSDMTIWRVVVRE